MDTIPAVVTEPHAPVVPVLENDEPSSTPLPVTDAAELQDVLTRYVDSRDGYLQAALLSPESGLAESFKAIAARREAIALRVADLINEQGLKADLDGSPEAGIHRWWIRLKEQASKSDMDSLLGECIRGEEELERTIEGALEDRMVQSAHAELLRDILAEVQVAIRSFKLAVGESA